MSKFISFVSQGNSYLASHRMRVQRPVELINIGIQENKIKAGISDVSLDNADLNIFFKHFDQKGNLTSVLQKKTLTCFDVCDDHFDKENGVYYKKMCQTVDVITCNTEAMRKRIVEVTGRDKKSIFVIPDPFMFEIQTAAFREAEELKNIKPKLIWFGNVQNYKPLQDWLDDLGSRVTVVCNQMVNHNNVDFIPWQPMMDEKQVAEHDIVLIPTDKDDPSIKTKSPNRAVDALAAGKFVITNNEEIYGDLKKFVYFADTPEDVQKGIQFYKDNYPKVRKMIENGQEYILKNHSNEAVIDGWLNVFKHVGIIKSSSKKKGESNSND